MLHMIGNKWSTIKILRSLKSEVETICESNEFSNPSQFIAYAVRKELEERSKNRLPERRLDDVEIKQKLESWIAELRTTIEMDEKLRLVQEKDISHTKKLSMNN